MNLKKTLVLAAILIGVLLYIFQIELPTTEKAENSEKPYYGVNASTFEKVALTHGDIKFALVNLPTEKKTEAQSDPVSADHPASKWEIDGIKGSDVDSGALNSLLGAILDLKLDNKILEEDLDKDLATYGLDKPVVELTVTAAGTPRTISFGKKNEWANQYYLKLSDRDGIYMVGDTLWKAATKGSAEFRDKTPIDFNDFDVSSFTLSSSSGTFEFTQDNQNNWKITRPGNFTASREKLRELFRQLKSAPVKSFIDPQSGSDKVDPTPYGLATPSVTLNINFVKESKADPLTITFGALTKDNGVVASISGKPSLYQFENAVLTPATTSIDDLREKQFMRLAVDDVVKATIEGEGEPITLMKRGIEWLVNNNEADAPFVKTFLKNLSETTAAGFPRMERDFGFAKPQLKITVNLKDGTTKTLVIGGEVPPDGLTEDKADSGMVYAATGDLSEAFLLDGEALKKITPRVETLLKSGGAPK